MKSISYIRRWDPPVLLSALKRENECFNCLFSSIDHLTLLYQTAFGTSFLLLGYTASLDIMSATCKWQMIFPYSQLCKGIRTVSNLHSKPGSPVLFKQLHGSEYQNFFPYSSFAFRVGDCWVPRAAVIRLINQWSAYCRKSWRAKIIFSEPISTAWKINFLSLIVGFYWRMTCNRGLESENLDDSIQVFLDRPSPSTTVNVKLR